MVEGVACSAKTKARTKQAECFLAAMTIGSDGGMILSEHENEPGGPHYGGNQGGESAGSSGGQGGQGEAEGELGKPGADQGDQSGGVGGRGPTERDRESTGDATTDEPQTQSGAARAVQKQRQMEESGAESPG